MERILYHGTRAGRLASILKDGLRSPYLAADPELAFIYAEAADGYGEEIVLSVSVNDAELVPDRPALVEPVGYAGVNSRILEERVLAHPVAWEDLTVADSLALVGSCLHPGLVAPVQINVLLGA